MFTHPEISAAVEGHAPGAGIAVTVDAIDLPTYETVDGKLPLDDKGNPKFIARRDAAGEHIKHPKPRAHLALGRVTITIDIEHGESESPHEHPRRTAEEMAAIVKVQTGNLLKEATCKPMTTAEHAALTQEQTHLAALRAAADRAKHAEEIRAQMSPDEIAAADYLAAHGEPDFAAHGEHLRRHAANLDHAVRLGAVTAAEATRERSRIAAWRRRCELRGAATVTHAADPAALADAIVKINEGV